MKFRIRLIKHGLPRPQFGAFTEEGHYVWGSSNRTIAGCMDSLRLLLNTPSLEIDGAGLVS